MSKGRRRICDELLNVVFDSPENQLNDLMRLIREKLDSPIASLWSVNLSGIKGHKLYASLIQRVVDIECPTDFGSDEDYVHSLKDSFIEDTLEYTKKTGEPFYECPLDQCLHHRSKETLRHYGLTSCIGIPIVLSKENAFATIVCLYYAGNHNNDQIYDVASFMGKYFSLMWHNLVIARKQMLSERMFEIKRRLGQKDTPERFFSLVLSELIKDQFDYEGASVFMWDTYSNHFKLVATTGIVPQTGKSKVYYYSGEGLTGKVAVGREIVIYDSLKEQKHNEDHIEKWAENTAHEGRTMMIIPILSISKQKEVIGIIRIINKINRWNPNAVDYFNILDAEIMRYLAEQLSLVFESYLGEVMRRDFLIQLSHEINTPAHSISKSAQMLLYHYNKGDFDFVNQNLRKYLDDILYYSEFQKWQTRTNLYLSKSHNGEPLSMQYSIRPIWLKDLLWRSKSLINPIARENNVPIDYIYMDRDIPQVKLFVDENAFVTVFYNLLTNAIKYRDPVRLFHIGIFAYETNDSISVSIEDYGLGIMPGEEDKIFQIGYRSENVCRYNASGFGVGLPVVKKLLNDFGGSIRITNRINPTRFRITLPLELKSIDYTLTDKWTK